MLTTRRLLAGIAILVVGLMAVIAIACILHSRTSGNEDSALRADNEASAIGALRAISAAEARYHQRCAGYANLSELMRTGELPHAKLTGGSTITTNGYKISIETKYPPIGSFVHSTSCFGVGGVGTDFFSHADPIALGRTGTRYFASDSRQTIFQDAAPMTYPPQGRQPQKAIR